MAKPKIAFVEMENPSKLSIYSLMKMPRGIAILCTLLDMAGYEVVGFVEQLKRFKWPELMHYDVICFSAITCTIQPTYSLIAKLRKAGYKGVIILGGPHSTAKPEEGILSGADYVVRHEGEITLLKLLKKIVRGRMPTRVPGVVFLQRGWIVHNLPRRLLTKEQLSALPAPTFQLLRGFENMTAIPLCFTRGCPERCIFCAVKAMFGLAHRLSSVCSRLGQILAVKRNQFGLWLKSIFITDDNAFGGVRGAYMTKEFCQQMIDNNLVPPKGWGCQMRVDDVTEETVVLMRKAGCELACLGIESTDDKTLKAVKKRVTREQEKTAIKILRAHHIRVMAMTVVGLDQDTFWSVLKTTLTLTWWGVDFLQILGIVPLPDTELAYQMEKECRILSRNYNLYNGHYVLVRPKNMSVFATRVAVKLFMPWFYLCTPNGWRLMLEFAPGFLKMIYTIAHQWTIGTVLRRV
ncbi:MAG: Radical SAM domain protein [Berkelbacteria bacterium GW2011_GWB1_38_5]|uniref:Radical SAM domain protein n=1 Tax=Berkelbacteria bacterium GW2011_GWB1_38_5 TaxID=1618336 RepID=A0A0G0MKB9_9BACT|nr:MAG: Radical SAM domain protein [Berkelbacteria bacterium GW2011_GWB1_38_5]